jgi:hypothetical protein
MKSRARYGKKNNAFLRWRQEEVLGWRQRQALYRHII